jgi:hypothetical protein
MGEGYHFKIIIQVLKLHWFVFALYLFSVSYFSRVQFIIVL